MMGTRPRVAILMATHNGTRFIDEQLDSILGQTGVDVTVFASDDASTDGTAALLRRRAAADSRLHVLPPARCGSAHANFIRLIRDVAADGFDAVGFSDQDDLWRPHRLAMQTEELSSGWDAVSSNVEAFTARGDRWIIRKDQPQRAFDWLLESGGPGSTFLLSNATFAFVQDVVRRDARVEGVGAHDWLVYALVRASGRRWKISHEPLVDYRQHDRNVLGANRGPSAAIARARMIAGGEFRRRAVLMGRIASDVASIEMRDQLERILTRMDGTRRERRSLARHASAFRRNPTDAAIMGWMMRLGLW